MYPPEETEFEYWSNSILGLVFLGTTFVAAKRMASSRSQGGAETTVVTAFYTLILLTAALRAIWFLIPNSIMTPSYTPMAAMAFDEENPSWLGDFVSDTILALGALCLFSIFILILVYWADILKKYFYPGARRSKPMITFIIIVSTLVGIQVLNSVFFLMGKYSTEGVVLVNAVVLAIVSAICVFEISVFSHRFRTVLKTLGAINQVSTESQVKRIVWITVTGNAFFATRAFLEIAFAGTLLFYWRSHGTVGRVFSHRYWDTYMLLKYTSEFAILCLMLYILKSRFTTNVETRDGYARVPNTVEGTGDISNKGQSEVAYSDGEWLKEQEAGDVSNKPLSQAVLV